MKRPHSLLVSVFAVLAVIVLVCVLFFVCPWLRLETTPVLLPDAVTGEESPDPADSSPFRKADVTPETVQAVIASLQRQPAYSRTVTVRTFWQDGSSSETITEQTSAGRTLLRAGKRNLLIRPDGLWIWYDNADGVYHCTADEAGYAQADVWLRSLTYEDMLALPPRAITGAGYMLFHDASCIYAEYTDGELGYLNRVYVSASTGLLMGCETYDGDTLIYSMTSDAPTLAEPDEALFAPPD